MARFVAAKSPEAHVLVKKRNAILSEAGGTVGVAAFETLVQNLVDVNEYMYKTWRLRDFGERSEAETYEQRYKRSLTNLLQEFIRLQPMLAERLRHLVDHPEDNPYNDKATRLLADVMKTDFQRLLRLAHEERDGDASGFEGLDFQIDRIHHNPIAIDELEWLLTGKDEGRLKHVLDYRTGDKATRRWNYELRKDHALPTTFGQRRPATVAVRAYPRKRGR